jgi:hypothetical protein
MGVQWTSHSCQTVLSRGGRQSAQLEQFQLVVSLAGQQPAHLLGPLQLVHMVRSGSRPPQLLRLLLVALPSLQLGRQALHLAQPQRLLSLTSRLRPPLLRRARFMEALRGLPCQQGMPQHLHPLLLPTSGCRMMAWVVQGAAPALLSPVGQRVVGGQGRGAQLGVRGVVRPLTGTGRLCTPSMWPSPPPYLRATSTPHGGWVGHACACLRVLEAWKPFWGAAWSNAATASVLKVKIGVQLHFFKSLETLPAWTPGHKYWWHAAAAFAVVLRHSPSLGDECGGTGHALRGGGPSDNLGHVSALGSTYQVGQVHIALSVVLQLVGIVASRTPPASLQVRSRSGHY